MKKGTLALSAITGLLSLQVNAQFGTYLDGTSQNGFTFSQVRSVGIGDFNLSTPTEARLHVRNSILNQPTASGYNGYLFRTDGFDNVDNSWKMFTENSSTFSEIFKLETPANTTNLLFQTTQSTGDMLFNTGGANQRAIITSSGLMGINEATPGNFLHVSTGSAGSSGLRFGNLTSASTPGSNPGTGVLTVDSNGDVILVTDGGGSGSVTGQNGLSNLSSSVLELGGDATNPTQVAASAFSNNRELPLNGNNMLWSGNGQFNISSTSPFPYSASVVGKINLDNSEADANIFCRTNATSLPGTISYSGYFENLTTGKGNYGIYSKTRADDGTVAGYFDAHSTNNLSTVNAVAGVATGGRYAQAGNFFAQPDLSFPGTLETYGLLGVGTDGVNRTYGVFGSALGDEAPEKYAVFGTVPTTRASQKSYGLYGESSGGNISTYASNSKAYGVYGIGGLADQNFGVYGQVGHDGIGNYAFAVYGHGNTLVSYNEVYGGFFTAGDNLGDISPVNIGVYATAVQNTAVASYAGYFNGDVFINGTGSSPSGIFTTSDRTIKKDIEDIKGAAALLLQIKPKTYHLTNQNVPQLKMEEDRLQYGVIAQEIEEVMPEVVREVTVLSDYDQDHNPLHDKKRLKSVNYTALVPLLIAGFNEQQKTIEDLKAQQTDTEELKKQVAELKAKLDVLTQTSAGTTNNGQSINTSVISISDQNILVLNQNVPNPFAESTVISYNIPQTFGKAELVFNTVDGKFIKSMPINQSGAGSVTVFASDLSKGIYSYSLVIDGKVLDTKRMIKQ